MVDGFRHVGDKVRYRGAFLRVDEAHFTAPDGTEHARDVVRHPGAVGVVVLDGDDVVLVRQYRAPIDDFVVEIVAGKIDETDTDPAETARREVVEEVGLRAGELEHVRSVLMTPGYCDEYLELYVASSLEPVERTPDGIEEHHMQTVRISLDEALTMVDDGRIDDAKTVLGLWAVAGRGRPQRS